MENTRGAGPGLRMMQRTDIAAVIAIERASFETGWPATAFERELTSNQMARYIILWERTGAGEQTVGFAGLWLMAEEAHIVTVAVLPGERGRGLGRMLVHGLVSLAMANGMKDATLECRVSNDAARGLYGRYGFYEVGLRKRYYSDNQEDAVIMTTELLDSEPYQRRFAKLERELRALLPGAALAVAEG